MTLAHRIAVMKDGKLQQFDTPATIYNRPANLFVAGFLGSPSMNLITEGAVTIGVRPEDIDFSLSEQPGWKPARVYVVEEMGNETIVRLAAEKTHLTVRVAAGIKLDFDQSCWYRLREEKLHRFDTSTGLRI
jgi:ABC-type sugar transport system ATPase subunit